MESPGSVTFWIDQLKAGNQAAAQALWEKYFQKLVVRTRRKLAGAPRGAADEEDVALSAFASFCRAAALGRFPQLHDRDDLWQLLIVLSDRKARNLVTRERRQRRGEGKVLDEAALAAQGASAAGPPLAKVVGREPSRDEVAQVAEECQRLLGLLRDAQLRRVAIRRMEGFTVEEIAEQEKRMPRTVKRWLRIIRQIWERENSQPFPGESPAVRGPHLDGDCFEKPSNSHAP